MRIFPDLSKPNATAEEVAHERKQLKRFLFIALFLVCATFATEYINSVYYAPSSPQNTVPPTPTTTVTIIPSPSPLVTIIPSPKSTSSAIVSPTTIPTKTLAPTQGMKACPMDAKLCPDGKTYVGRSGPNCEFVACPK